MALDNVADWCMRHFEEEREHAKHLIDFQTKRGGRVVLTEIQVSAECSSGLLFIITRYAALA